MKTIRQSIQDVSIYAFLGISIVMFTSFILYSFKKTKVAEEATRSDLLINLTGQVRMFLPSYLLPEQRLGVDLILNRIKSEEDLEDVQVFQDSEKIVDQFPNCILNNSQVVSCISADSSSIAVIAPLVDSNEHFGYLLKSKKISSAASLLGLVQIAGAILVLLGMSFILFYFCITNLIAKKIPLALDNLVAWIEAEMHDEKRQQQNLHFKELDDVRSKISEIITHYHQTRDQAVIGQVTSGIMHDIKTPLQSIVSATFLVSEQELGSQKRLARLENLFRMCTANLPVIGEIIETTLDGNRNIQIYKTRGNLKDLVESSLRHNKEFSRLRNVSVELDSSHEVLAQFDQSQFLRVINNLVKNGIESASGNKLSNPFVRVTVQDESSSEVRIIVEDSGVGFTGSTDKVFSAFRTTKAHGSGLGLMISKKIVEAHAGKIIASNTSYLGGAKLEVILPKQGEILC